MNNVAANVNALLLAVILFAASWPGAAAHAEEKALPETCQQACVTEFGAELGKTPDGVVAYSNCKPKCVFESPMTVDGTYTGIKWQCVEYARRWLLKHKGAVFASVDYAFEIWSKIDSLEKPGTKEKLALENFPNGSKSAPKPGDLLIYSQEHEGTGHVAVVTGVNFAKQYVSVAEQNFRNEKWQKKDFARWVPLVKHRGGYWVLDPYLLGWKRVR